MVDGQERRAEEVSDVLAEAHRLARIVERIPALALLMAMPTLRDPRAKTANPLSMVPHMYEDFFPLVLYYRSQHP
jgi:hypothetical protein